MLLTLTAVLSTSTFFYMRQARFGQVPAGEHLAAIQRSPNYKNGQFVNRVERPTITPGFSMTKVAYRSLFTRHEGNVPRGPLPSVKTDLRSLPQDSDLVVWFGHSSFYMQLGGKRFLVDPVFSGSASPIPSSVKAFRGTDVYTVADMPEIDHLFISHDHYDHLDHKTVVELRPKVKQVICGLGVGAHLAYWSYDKDKIIEKDWYDTLELGNGAIMHILPTHHSSGRSLKQKKTLWISFLVEYNGFKLFYSGDGGYDEIYREIGEKYGEIDFALMEFGQYNPAWRSVHKLPEEVERATIDINAKRMMPVHHSKFALAHHPWDEPLRLATAFAKDAPFSLATPMIGEVVYLRRPEQVFEQWWLDLERSREGKGETMAGSKGSGGKR